MRRARKRVLSAAAALGLSAVAALACNQILGVSDNATSGDGAVVATPTAGACEQDSDCPSIGCYVGQCDDYVHVCRYGLCKGRGDVCQRATCTNNTCSQTKTPYNFESNAIAVDGVTLACGGDPKLCMVAMYPFVILGTTKGLQ